jgi:hypothetical protein
MMEEMLSSGQTCDASSKITRSKSFSPVSRNWLTLSGLIIQHGFNSSNAGAVFCTVLRIGP